MPSDEIKRGTVGANGLQFHFLEVGQGPLALCCHGFPDSPGTWRYLMPALAQAGYRAVAPYMRGFAPTDVPAGPAFDVPTLAADVCALHRSLGGGADAVLVGHDWGALAVYGAALTAPGQWRRCVTLSVPPLPVFARIAFDYAQIKRSFYFWFFQMKAAGAVVGAAELAFIDHLWADWSPDFDSPGDLAAAKQCLARPENLEAALGYYRVNLHPDRFGLSVPDHPPLAQPLLYLHGDHDGCIALPDELLQAVCAYGGPGSRAARIGNAGHFLTVEQPGAVNPQIVDFLGRAGG
jgi:pimeloyl-ACP methyl ester carboxylesterase